MKRQRAKFPLDLYWVSKIYKTKGRFIIFEDDRVGKKIIAFPVFF